MFEGFSKETIDFMWNLRLNNNKPWFEEHKSAYQQHLLQPMKELAQELFQELIKACGEKGFSYKVSRIYKDARRLHGQEPYRDHLWLTIEKPSEEWTCTPVFWFELTPENWSYGLGYYQARPETMAKLRARIDHAPKAFDKLVAALDKQQEFILDGPEYARKKSPAEPTARNTAWYNKKSLSLHHSQPSGDEIFSAEIKNRVLSGYQFLMPFYDYLATLDADPTPAPTLGKNNRR